jgi:uncharacterized protein YegP (UPF0339 family)
MTMHRKARSSKYEYWKAAPKDWRWHLKGKNGEIQGQGEGHPTRAGVKRAIERHRASAWTAEIVEIEVS